MEKVIISQINLQSARLKGAERDVVHPNKFPKFPTGHHYGLYGRTLFHDLLTKERKRTERTQNPFIMMLVNIERLLKKRTRKKTLSKVLRIVSSSARDSDLKGWYASDHIIGIIFTDTDKEFKDSIEKSLIDKLSNFLDSESLRDVEISFHVYPEEKEKSKLANSEPDPNLYTHLADVKTSNKIALICKRGIDIVGSIVGILLFSPLFIIIPVMIKLTSKGPVLFKQERVGQFGKRFAFLKFRSMHMNNDDSVHRQYVKSLIKHQQCANESEEKGKKKPVYKLTNDPRVTPIGEMLRKTSMDELPQFFNVLFGDMSLVGPRPPISYELEDYDYWHRMRVLDLKPGITGPWQVGGRSSTTFDEMVRLDLQYIEEWSVWLDIKILLKTPWVVITGKGGH